MIFHTESTLNSQFCIVFRKVPPHQISFVSFLTALQRHIVKVLSAHTTGVCQQHHTWLASARRLETGRLACLSQYTIHQGVNE